MEQHSFMKFIVLAAFTAGSMQASAQSSLETFAIIEAGYNDFDFTEQPLTSILPNGYGYSDTGAALDRSSSAEFGPMNFSATARSSAAFQSLGTYAGGSLENSFFEPYFPENGPEGVENFFNAFASASWTDTLSYGGTAVGYNSRYLLNLSGSLFGEDAFNIVTIQHANEPVQRWSFFNEGDYDIQLVSNAFVHGAFAQEFTVTLQSYFQVYTGYLADGSSSIGIADFENTLVLGGIELRDDNGILQPNGTITSASGTNYDIIAIPEPSAGLLTLSCSALLLARRRR